MNTHSDELERELRRDLQRQVDGMSGVPFGLDDVKGRAWRIRRHRRIAAGVGVAAALAVIVPTSITAGGMLEGKDQIQPAQSPDVPVEVSRTTLTVRDLPRGAAPAIEYFTPDGVVLPGQGTQRLRESYQALVPSQGGWLALGPALDEVVRLSEDFEPEGRSTSGNHLATTPDRDHVAWTVPGAGAQTISVHSTADPDEATSWDFPDAPAVEPVGILGPDSVVYEARDARGGTTVGLAGPDGTTTELPYRGAEAADPVNGLIAVRVEDSRDGSCFAVVDATTLQPTWGTCEYRLGSFSPDGRYVMAAAADSDGIGPSSLSVLDALTGDLVADFSSRGRQVVALIRPAWESPDAIVATASEGNITTMVRLAVDGTLEEVADPVEGSAYDDVPYYTGADRAGL